MSISNPRIPAQASIAPAKAALGSELREESAAPVMRMQAPTSEKPAIPGVKLAAFPIKRDIDTKTYDRLYASISAKHIMSKSDTIEVRGMRADREGYTALCSVHLWNKPGTNDSAHFLVHIFANGNTGDAVPAKVIG